MPVNFASMLQAARGQRGQPPDIQQTLANMRQQLYGMPAQGGQAVGQPNLGGDMIQQPNLGAGNISDLMQRNPPQAPGKPAWQQLAELGIGGQGSPAANQAALAAAQGGAAAPGVSGNIGDALQAATGGGLQAGAPPGSGFVDPMNVTLDRMNVTPEIVARFQADVERMQREGVDVNGNPIQLIAWNGGRNPSAPTAPQTVQTLPATMTIPPNPNIKPALQGAMTPGVMQPRQPAQQRIAAARQGIRQGVQQALRKPARAPVSAGPRGATR
jgi:hypothetical protein